MAATAYDNNSVINLVIPPGLISSLNNNTGTIIVGDGSFVLDCLDNRGRISFESNTEISNISRNNGKITIGPAAQLGTISYNMANIYIKPNTKMHKIEFNTGIIHCGENCSVEEIRHNYGDILGMPVVMVRRLPHVPRNALQVPRVQVPQGSRSVQHVPPRTVPQITATVTTQAPSRTVTLVPSQPYNNPNNFTVGSTASCGHDSCATRTVTIRATIGGTLVPATVTVNGATPRPLANSTSAKVQNNSVTEDVNKFECSVCMEKTIDIAFSCGHVCCSRCAQSLVNCHMCRQKISNKLQLFF